jgi:cytochrome bd-type quinol oxidase subunit 1
LEKINYKKKNMKLYNVPRNSKIRVVGDIKIPPAAPIIEEQEVLNFSHVDGMYSYCTNKDGEVVHLVAWAEVEVIDDKNTEN